MRLDEHEKRALKYALQEFDGNVYIFGSRINDKKKGGILTCFSFLREKQTS